MAGAFRRFGTAAFLLLSTTQLPLPAAPSDGVAEPPLPLGAIARMGSSRFRHGSEVACLSFSPDGTRLASGGPNGTVAVWEVPGGRLLGRFGMPDRTLHLSAVALALLDNGRTVAAVHGDTAHFWDVATGREAAVLGVGGRLESAAFSADGRWLATGDADIRIWDVRRRQAVRVIPAGQGAVTELAFTADGGKLASGGADGSLAIWDVDTGRRVRRLEGHTGAVRALAFTPDKRLLASGTGGRIRGLSESATKEVFLWDVATGKVQRRLKEYRLEDAVLAFSSDGRLLVLGHGRYFDRYETAPWRELSDLKLPRSHRGAPLSLAFAPNSRLLASGLRDGVIRLWSMPDGTPVSEPAGHLAPWTGAAFTPDGRSVATTAEDETLRLWDAATGAEARTVREPAERESSGHWRPTVSPDGRLVVWSAGLGAQAHRLDTGARVWKAHRLQVGLHATFAPDGSAFLGGEFLGALDAVDAATGKLLGRFARDGAMSLTLALSPQGHKLAARTGVGRNLQLQVRVWDRKEERPPQAVSDNFFDGRALAFDCDGALLAVGGADGSIRLWDVNRGTTASHCTGHGTSVDCLAFARDGRTLLSAGDDGILRLWEVATGQERLRLVGHPGPVEKLALSADGRLAVSGGTDGLGLIWDATGRHARRRGARALESCWRDLASEDATLAYRALWELVDHPDEAVRLLGGLLRPAEAVAPEQVTDVIKRLEANDVADRRRAADELERLGDLAGPALQRLLAGKPPLELRQRAESVLARATAWTGPRLQVVRAVETMERIGTPAAQAVLEALAKGAPDNRGTQAAKGSLGRLKNR